MNLPRWLIFLIILVLCWLVLKMTVFADKKLFEFDKSTQDRMGKVEQALQ